MDKPDAHSLSSSKSYRMQFDDDCDTSCQDAAISLTQYHEYPTSRPFINSEFRRVSGKLSNSFPENNRDAVVSALRNLQDKVRRLELERSAAEDNLKSLASETNRYKDILQTEHEHKDYTSALVNRQTKELGSQLSSAETKCQMLEKQLDYMRKMVHTVEKDRLNAVTTTSTTLLSEPLTATELPRKLKVQAERLSDLEREHLKMTATQNIAESKIRDLEDKLREERMNRRLISKRASNLEAEVADRVLYNGEQTCRPILKTKKQTKKKKKKVTVQKKSCAPPPRRPGTHYRLNLADIPFVAGKATTASHSVGANVQRVLAWMKNHNTALCSGAYNNQPLENGATSSSSSSSLDNDLSDILLALQDEFGQLSCEHQELVKQINETSDSRLRDDMERELDTLVTRMEVKGQQISKVRQHQHKLDDAHKSKSTHKVRDQRPRSANANIPSQSKTCQNSHCHGKPKNVCRKTNSARSQTLSARHVSLDVLKDMKKLQSTLRKDDLYWE